MGTSLRHSNAVQCGIGREYLLKGGMIVGLQVDQQPDGSRCRILVPTGPLNLLYTRSGLRDAFQNSECCFWSIHLTVIAMYKSSQT